MKAKIKQTALGELNCSWYKRRREPDMEVPSEVYWAEGTYPCKR